MKTRIIIIICCISAFVACLYINSTVVRLNRVEKVEFIENGDLEIAEIYKHAQNYLNKNIGKKYKLIQINMKLNNEMKGDVEFVFKKSGKGFIPICIVKVDTLTNLISNSRQLNSRGFAREHSVRLEKWNVDIEDIVNLTALKFCDDESFSYDEIEIFCCVGAEDSIEVNFTNKTTKFVAYINPYTKNVYGEYRW